MQIYIAQIDRWMSDIVGCSKSVFCYEYQRLSKIVVRAAVLEKIRRNRRRKYISHRNATIALSPVIAVGTWREFYGNFLPHLVW